MHSASSLHRGSTVGTQPLGASRDGGEYRDRPAKRRYHECWPGREGAHSSSGLAGSCGGQVGTHRWLNWYSAHVTLERQEGKGEQQLNELGRCLLGFSRQKCLIFVIGASDGNTALEAMSWVSQGQEEPQ